MGQLGSFEEIKMAVSLVIKLPQTKAIVFLQKKGVGGGERRKEKGGRKLGKAN